MLRRRLGRGMEDKLNDKWINIEEAAEYLGVKPVTFRGWICNDKGDTSTQDWKTVEV